MIRLTYLLVGVVFLYGGCVSKGNDNRRECLNKLVMEMQGTSDYDEVKRLFTDTLNSWVAMGISTMQGLRHEQWKIDLILFNNSYDKALIWVNEIDTTESAKFNYIEVYGAQLRKDGWKFYSASYPTIAIDKDQNQKTENETFASLSEFSRANLIKGGLIKNDCSVDTKFIESYFEGDLDRLHDRFLRNRVR